MEDPLIEAKEIAKYFAADPQIRDHILSIYTMGSFARGNYQKTSDIDLNIFVKSSNGKLIDNISRRLKETENYFGREIDNNIITDTSYLDDQINSDIFCQKNRHALFIYEVKTSNAFLWGKDILENLKFEYRFLLPETLKLIQTQVYRLSKLLLAKKPDSTQLQTQAVKYVLYSAQFYLINCGYLIKLTEDIRKLFTVVTKGIVSDSNQKFICELYEKRELRNYTLTYEEILHCYDALEIMAELSMKKFVALRNTKEITYPKNQKLIGHELKRLIKIYRKRMNANLILNVGPPGEVVSAKSSKGSVFISLNPERRGDYLITCIHDLDMLFRYSKYLNEY